jgi:DNA-binding response OmpR family regulator
MANKILVVEDDMNALRLVTYALEQEGYETVTAKDGLEGLRQARDESPDLIILDVMLPGLDGYEVCHELRQQPETSIVPILMTSVKARPEDINIGLRLGADDYLMKPVDPEIILDRVKDLLSNSDGIVAE